MRLRGVGQRFIVCHQCGLRVRDRPYNARERGWRLWIGGARCPDCLEENAFLLAEEERERARSDKLTS